MSENPLISETFFGFIFAAEMDRALALVDPNATFVATRPDKNPNNPLHGTYRGPDGARSFFDLFVSLVEPGAFAVEGRCKDGTTEVLYGRLSHVIRRNGAVFTSDWAAITRLRDGKIVDWHFYEDSESLRSALDR